MANFYAQYPASASGSNASVGANGAPAPAFSTEIGGIGVDGNLHPLSVTNAGVLNVNVASTTTTPLPVTDAASEASLASLDSKTVHVDTGAVVVASSALPTGAATAANQATEIASLASIDTKLTSPLTVTGPLTDAQLRATPVPVSGTVTTTNTANGATGAAVPAQATQVAGSDGTNLRALKVSATGVLSVDASASTQPVSGTVTVTQATGTNLHTVVDSSALPTGASTLAAQTTGNTSLSSIDGKTPSLGQAAMAASVPVVLASNQSSIPVAATLQAGAAIIGKVAIDQTTPGTTNGVQVNAALPAGTNVIGHVITDTGSTTAVTGTVAISAASLPLPTGAATETTLAKLAVTQGSTTSGQSGTLTLGAVTTAAPTYTTGQSSPLSLDTTGALRVNASVTTSVPTASTATLSNVASSASSVSLLASNASRKQATFFNDSTQILYLKFGTTASATSYTVQIPSNGYYEIPVAIYTGAIDGIWAAANGNARITEMT